MRRRKRGDGGRFIGMRFSQRHAFVQTAHTVQSRSGPASSRSVNRERKREGELERERARGNLKHSGSTLPAGGLPPLCTLDTEPTRLRTLEFYYPIIISFIIYKNMGAVHTDTY